MIHDSSHYVLATMLGHKHLKLFHTIYYGSKVLNENQINYTKTKKEVLAIIFSLEKLVHI